MDNKYKEIFKLKKLLTDARIPFRFVNDSFELDNFKTTTYHIFYPDREKVVCSVIEGDHSYGSKYDLLEIRGLLTRREHKHDLVAGFLTAEEVFKRIERHYKKKK
ncbi:MAG: hypothetical protein IKC49_03175 [Clostridia bacterium]|nr:hypothetical protein [Clostridia bacterium]